MVTKYRHPFAIDGGLSLSRFGTESWRTGLGKGLVAGGMRVKLSIIITDEVAVVKKNIVVWEVYVASELSGRNGRAFTTETQRTRRMGDGGTSVCWGPA